MRKDFVSCDGIEATTSKESKSSEMWQHAADEGETVRATDKLGQELYQ